MNAVEEKFQFLSFDSNETIPNETITGLLNEDLTGICIKNFLSLPNVEQILKGFRGIPDTDKTKINDGFTSSPLSFAQFTQQVENKSMSVEDYTQLAEELLEQEERLFGISISEMVCQFLTKHQAFEKASPIITPQNGKRLVPYNFRELFPGNGELIAHCENLFFTEFPAFFNWLKLMNIVDNKLSFFITLQNADKGGELCCFDLNWLDVNQRKEPTLLEDRQGNIINLETDNIDTFMVKPDVGDLLLFAGGNVWHRVNKVQGSQSRITVGGFVAETTNKSEYFIWS